jgi:hypothetical protein
MRLTITGLLSDREVIAEPFDIDGSAEKFAVHAALGPDRAERGQFAATHIETGFAIAFGDTVDEAIEAGRAAWLSKAPEERLARIEGARQFRSAREADAQGGVH